MIRTLLVTCFLLLSACNQINNQGSVKPSASSNTIAVANLRLAIAYMEQGDYEQSLTKLNKALAADPNYHASHNVMGILHQRLGQPTEAERSFKRSLSLSPKEPTTLNNYGQFLCAENRIDEAEKAFIKASDNPLYETPEVAMTNAGNCALRNANNEKAESYFRSALEKNSLFAPALIQMAQISFQTENLLSSRAYLQRYLEVANPTAKSLWLGIQVEQRLGDKDIVSSNAMLLRNNYPNSEETKLLNESGIQ